MEKAFHNRIKNITQKAGKWYAAVQVEQEIEIGRHPCESRIGMDAGIKCFAAFSNGKVIEGLHSFRRYEYALTRDQRTGKNRNEKYHGFIIASRM